MTTSKRLYLLTGAVLLIGAVLQMMPSAGTAASAEPTTSQGPGADLYDPPPPVTTPPTALEFQVAMRKSQAKTLAANEVHRMLAGAGGLEVGSAGFHIAAAVVVIDAYGDGLRTNLQNTNPTGFLFWNVDSMGHSINFLNGPPADEVFWGDLAATYPDCTTAKTVTISDPLPRSDFVASVIPGTDNTLGSIRIDFQNTSSLQALIGDPNSNVAGFDWMKIWRQAGELCTNCDLILVTNDVPVGYFSRRDVVANDLTTTVIMALDQSGPLHLPLSECDLLVAQLNAP